MFCNRTFPSGREAPQSLYCSGSRWIIFVDFSVTAVKISQCSRTFPMITFWFLHIRFGSYRSRAGKSSCGSSSHLRTSRRTKTDRCDARTSGDAKPLVRSVAILGRGSLGGFLFQNLTGCASLFLTRSRSHRGSVGGRPNILEDPHADVE